MFHLDLLGLCRQMLVYNVNTLNFSLWVIDCHSLIKLQVGTLFFGEIMHSVFFTFFSIFLVIYLLLHIILIGSHQNAVVSISQVMNSLSTNTHTLKEVGVSLEE